MPVEQMNKAVKILVVDDQPGMRLTLKAILSKKGYSVEIAEDGEQAVQMAKDNDFRVIFMDIKMPGISGVDAYLKIKEISPRTTVIMMTAFALEEEIKLAIREGAYAVMHKPLDIEKILGVVTECLENKTLVLLVDDQFEDLELVKLTLERKGFQVTTAQSSSECMHAVTEKRFQIILMDYRMPAVDGIQTLKQVKQVRPDVGVILMSAYTSQELVKKAVEQGSFACVKKPFDTEQLLSTIDQCLKSRKP